MKAFALGVLVVCAAFAGGSASATAGSAARPGPYFLAPFKVKQNSHTFGQTPSFSRNGDVLSQEVDGSGILQIQRSKLNGSGMKCVTCDKLPGPNGYPEERPQGDWIAFSSYGAQSQHFGAPGLGGYGGDLNVIRPNGTGVTRLTISSDPNNGAQYNVPDGIPYDNYHPMWSPDGKHLAWTRAEAHPIADGGQTWEIMLADFVAPKNGKPHLKNIRVVGPAFGVYETQHWAPDGSGFLFSSFGPRNSPFQAHPPGWMHQQVYFMRLYGKGASPAHPRVTLITDDVPVYQEQAEFTPDMREVMFMSNRNSTDGTWYNAVIAAAQRTKFDAPLPGTAGTLQFLADFSDPDFRSDLFMVDVRTHALRQLTDFHNVVPEFHWNRQYTKLLWSGVVGGGNKNFITRVGSFPSIKPKQRLTHGKIPAPGLYGKPIRMERIQSPAPARSPLGSLELKPSPSAVSKAIGDPIEVKGNDVQAIPPVVVSYFLLWLQQIKDLGDAAGVDIGTSPINLGG